MKNYFILFLLFISSFSFAQSKSKEVNSIKKSKLSEVKLLGDLVTDVSKDKFVAMEITAKVGGTLKVAECKSFELNENVLNILKNADAGSKIYIDVKITDGQKTKAISTAFLVKE